MTQTNKQTNNKKDNLTLLDMFKSPFNFNTFDNNKILNTKVGIIYSSIYLLLTLIVSVFRYNIQVNSTQTYTITFFYNLIGLILLTLIVFGIYYILLNAFEKKKKSFITSLLVFTSILYPFIFIGNLINYINYIIAMNIIAVISLLFITIIIIYMITLFIISFKKYYKTSGFKVAASLILTQIILITLLIFFYLSYLINSIY
ncbi:MAG: hypothetical protein ACOC16_02960 [Nanoarchaeota archaeon]